MMVRDWSMGADENEEEEKQSENVKENTVFQHMVRPPPVGVFLQHLVDADAERLVVITFVDKVFINTKLRRGHGFALRDP